MITIKNKFTTATIDEDLNVKGNNQSTIELIQYQIEEAKRRSLEPPFNSVLVGLYYQLKEEGIYQITTEDGFINEDIDEDVIN